VLISVLIDNYNYERYLKECIESVLAQTYTNFEIIIVDDGSSDNSKDIILEYANKDNRIKPIFKTNNGQASAFNEGIKHCMGEVICFLDSDDKFKPNKLEEVIKAYKKGYEYIINDYEIIGQKYTNAPYAPYGGYNLFLVYYKNIFIGSTTSNISISKNLAKKIFPIKREDFFRVRADDVVVFYASMMRESYFIHHQLSEYRIHGSNLFASNYKKITNSQKYKRFLVMSEVKKEILSKMNIDNSFLNNGYFLFSEFTTKHIIDFHILKVYLEILWFEMKIPFVKKLQISYNLLKYFNKYKRNFIPSKKVHF